MSAAAGPAQARPAFATSAIMAPSALYSAVSAACAASQTASLTPVTANQSKSGAILGSSMSKLERMRMEQSAASTPRIAAVRPSDASAFANTEPLRPAVGMARQPFSFCAPRQDASGLAAVRQAPAVTTRAVYSKDDFLASKRITIGRTVFDQSWNRVRSDELSPGAVRRYLGQSNAQGVELLAQVNRWANRRIRYVEDRELHGQADYWAGADTTLKLGSGDCEDIAIVKMQMLAAAGVPREDMFLTIARDLARNADHAVLVVRTDRGYYLLDNAVDRLVDASGANDYRPVISFNDRTSWLHGY